MDQLGFEAKDLNTSHAEALATEPAAHLLHIAALCRGLSQIPTDSLSLSL